MMAQLLWNNQLFGRVLVARWVIVGLAASVGIVAIQREIAVWQRAADLRDRVLSSIVTAQTAGCGSVSVDALPDHLDGAYVFRNGFESAAPNIERAANSGEACQLAWTDEGFVRR